MSITRFQWLMVALVALLAWASPSAAEEHYGIDWIAFPTFEGNSDTGFVFGGQASVIDYGKTTHAAFPFLWETQVKASYSTTNRHDYRLIFDAPGLFGDSIAFFSQVEFVHIADANWFGVGNTNLDSTEDYNYRLTEPGVEASIAKRFSGDFYYGGGLKFLLSLVRFDAGSRLAADQPLGSDGDRNLIGVTFIGFERKDDPFSPRRGTQFEAYLKGTTTPISRFSWAGFGFYGTGYVPVIWEDLVFAQRFSFETLQGDVPISQLVRLGGSRTYRGLGGVFSQRGFAESRFAGSSKALSNSELRYYFPALFDSLVFGLGAFTDISKVIGETDWNPSYGGEVSIAWKDAFLFRIDYGLSREGNEFYIEGRHLF